MKKVSHKAPKVKAIHKDDKTPESPTEEELDALDTRIALIQALILKSHMTFVVIYLLCSRSLDYP